MALDLKPLKQQLSQLIAQPSVSSTNAALDQGNRAVIDTLANWLEVLGFSIDIQAVNDNGSKANLIATLGHGSQGLVFSGHTDTVPFNAERWGSDPFKLEEKDQRWYGLGATDMKGFFPVVLAALEAFCQQKKRLRQPIIILATADEESSMSGARALAASGRPNARYAVIGEPTGLRPIRMHKGIMMESIRITGQAGHSSNPALGKNALEAMHLALTELLAFREQLQQQKHPAFAIEFPTLNLGCIHGGDNPNRICGSAELHFDLRALPGMDNATLRADLVKRMQKISQQTQMPIDVSSLIPGVSSFEEAADSELVQLCEKLSGHPAEAVAFATEAPFLQELGMQTLVMGPGSIDQAHQPDEFLSLDQIEPAVRLYQQLIERCCC